MKKYTTSELVIAWKELWNTEADDLWRSINNELARRMTKDEYKALTNAK